MPGLTVYLDMDGVVADFVTRLADRLGCPEKGTLGPNPPVGRYDCCPHFGVTNDEMWATINQDSFAFWRSLPVFPWSHRLVRSIQERSYVERLVWCSKPGANPGGVAGKLQWLHDKSSGFFGCDTCEDYIFTPQKELLAKPGAVLIDDCPANCAAFEAEGGAAILFPMPWNDACDGRSPGEVKVRSVLAVLDVIARSLNLVGAA